MYRYVIPGEIFPTAARATCHGLSAASGKCGAALGAFVFGSVIEATGLRGTFLITSALTVVLIAWASVLTPRYDEHTLERLDEAHRDGTAVALLYARRRP